MRNALQGLGALLLGLGLHGGSWAQVVPPAGPVNVLAGFRATQTTFRESAGRGILFFDLKPAGILLDNYTATFDVSLRQIRARSPRGRVTLATPRFTVTGGSQPTTVEIVLNLGDDASPGPDQVFEVLVTLASVAGGPTMTPIPTTPTPATPDATPNLPSVPNATPGLPDVGPNLPDLTPNVPDLTPNLPDLTPNLPGNNNPLLPLRLVRVDPVMLTLTTAVATVVVQDDDSGVAPAETLADASQNPAQAGIGTAVGNACASGLPGASAALEGLDLQNLCNELVGAANSGDPNLTGALQQLAPEEFATQTRVAVDAVGVQFGNVYQRLTQLRAGARGVNVAGLNLYDGHQALNGNLLAALWQPQGQAAGEAISGFERWGLFASGTAGWGERDTTQQEAGFSFDTRGLTFGADYRFSDRFVLGAAYGYSSTDNALNADSGQVDVRGRQFSLFGTYYQADHFALDAVLSYGRNDYDNERRIRYALLFGTPIDQLARSQTEGEQLGLSLGASHTLPMGSWTLTSNARLEYIRAEVEGFGEALDATQPGFGLGLQLDAQEAESLTLALGGQLSYAWSRSWGVLLPYLSFDWVHEFANDAQTLTGTFLNDPGAQPFTLTTDDPDRDYFDLSLGLVTQLTQGRSAFIQYRTTLGLDATESASLSAGFRLEF